MEFNESNLNNLSLISLRDIGKSIGVRAPTALTKKKLVSAILDVHEERVKPFYTKRGRPNLKTVDNFEVIHVVKTVPDEALIDQAFEKVLDVYLQKLKKELLKIYKNIE